MNDLDRLTWVATYDNLEQAEEAGERLLSHGIGPQVMGRSLMVASRDFDRAVEILDIQPEGPPEKPQPFHPCPKCGADDPVWFGKRKLMLLIGTVVILPLISRSDFFTLAVVVAIVGFVLAAWWIPEYECRQCRHRWSKDLR
jgi:hypothetical protein